MKGTLITRLKKYKKKKKKRNLKNKKVFHRPFWWFLVLSDIFNFGVFTYSAAKGTWSEDQENELQTLFMENQANPSTDKGKIKLLIT